jgi:hypothetical protein
MSWRERRSTDIYMRWRRIAATEEPERPDGLCLQTQRRVAAVPDGDSNPCCRRKTDTTVPYEPRQRWRST